MKARRHPTSHAFLILLLVMFTLTTKLTAQVVDPVVAAQTPIPGSAHHYIGLGAETVNPADGTLTFDLPIEVPRGRGLNMTFGIRYSGNEHLYIGDNDCINCPLTWMYQNGTLANSSVGSWTVDLPTLSAQTQLAQATYTQDPISGTTIDFGCAGTGSYVFKGLDQVSHTLKLTTIYTEWNNDWPTRSDPCTPQFGPPDDHHGIFASFTGPNTVPTPPSVSVTDQSGTVYKFGQGPRYYINKTNPQTQFFSLLAQSITDRNGNTITLSQDASGSPTYVDPLGRNVVSWGSFSPTNSTGSITVAGLDQPIVEHWTSVPITLNVTGQRVSQTGYPAGGCTGGSSQSTGGGISEIDLPNGTKYTISYESTYGRISKITFPNGGYVRYVWGVNPRSATVAVTEWVPSTAPYQPPYQVSCVYQYDSPAVTDRYVSYDGTSEVLHQQFSYTTNWSTNGGSWTSKQTTVVSTDLTQSLPALQTSTQIYTYSPVSADLGGLANPSWTGNEVPVETKVQFIDGLSNTQQTVFETWLNTFVLLGKQTLMNDQVSATTDYYCVDGNEQVTALYEVGFSSEGSAFSPPSCYAPAAGSITSNVGPLRRQTVTAYHPYWAAGTQSGTHIVNAPDSTIVQDGAGAIVSKTLFTYTDSVSASGATTGLSAPPGANRGNIASVSKYIDTTNAAISTYTWYNTGNLASITDPCGNGSCPDINGSVHTTTYIYDDNNASCGGTAPLTGATAAYLTQVRLPNTHTRQFCWGYDDGQLRSVTDENGLTTSFSYIDVFRRLTRITPPPDGGQTDITYNDGTYSFGVSPSFTVTTRQNSSGSASTKRTSFDGMGHQVQTAVQTDPSTWIHTDTSYDGLGRAWKVTNPYYSASDTTYGIVTTTHDVLGRSLTTTQQDQVSTISRTYTGPCETVTDESLKTRKSCTNSLGFLTSVVEDPSGLGYSTSYYYNALGDLTNVTQGTQTRAFVYDFLSRLQSANNPESGTITYDYDLNGNVLDRIAPAPNQASSSSSVKTNYFYDVLNRLTDKSYSCSAGTCPNLNLTANSHFTYDGGDPFAQHGSSVGYPIGRRTSSFTGTQAAPITATYLKYDQMGRAIEDHQYNSVTGWRTQAYQYEYTGQPLTYNPGFGSTLTFGYDLADRVTYLTSSLSDAQHPAALLSNVQYTAAGAMRAESLGNGLREESNYDRRNRIVSHTVGADPSKIITSTNTPPFGWTDYAINQNGQQAIVQGAILSVGGWAADQEDGAAIARVEVQLDGQDIGEAVLGSYRPDVASALNNSAYAYSGWTFSAPLTNLSIGQHTVSAIATDWDGNQTVLSPGSTTITVAADQSPYGWLDSAINQSTGQPSIPQGGTLHAQGWAADPDSTPNSPIARVDVFIDTSFFGSASLGDPRQDVANIFGNGYLNSGWHLDKAIGNLAQGYHSVTARAYDSAGGNSVLSENTAMIYVTGSNTGTLPPPSQSIYNFRLAYFGNSNILSAADSVNDTWSYGYDGVNRLSTASSAASKYSYDYDQFGNRLHQNVTGGMGITRSFTYTDQKNHIDGVTHDAAGNITYFLDPVNGSTYLVYDAENRIVSATQNGITANYTYDADGRRFVSSGNGTRINMFDLAGNTVAELASDGSMNRWDVYLGSRQLASYTNTSTYFNHTDWLGTLRARTDVTGHLCSTTTSLPYGDNQVNAGNCDIGRKHFTGKERDSETGLDYFGARYYGSSMGRWMSPDWAASAEPVPYADLSDPRTLNLYGYVRNNPLSHADADGHCCDDLIDFTLGAVNAWSSDNLIGLGRVEQTSTAGKIGAAIGDAGAMVTGTLEVLGGGGEALVTSPAAATGVGAIVPALGVVVALHGSGTALIASANLLKSADAKGGTTEGGLKKGSEGGPGAGKKATSEQRAQALGENGGKCSVAGCNNPAEHADHAIPRSRNGDTTAENLQGMCAHHNCQKGAKTSEEYEQWRKDHQGKK